MTSIRSGFYIDLGFYIDIYISTVGPALHAYALHLASGTFGRRRLGAGYLGAGHLGAWTIECQNSAPDNCRVFF